MKCPRCRKALLPQKAADVSVDVCIACEGVWFDAGELKAVLGSGSALEATPLAATLHGQAPNTDEPVSCPRCERGLERRPTAESGVPVHSCPAGCGVWLDDGELRPVARAFAAEADKKARASALGRLRRLFGS